MVARCGQPDCDCGHTIEKLRDALEAIIELADYLPKDANVGGATFQLLDEIQAKARAALGESL